jgi:hypothetical protein
MMLLDGPERLDKVPDNFEKTETGPHEALATLKDILISPVLRRVLCNPTNFSFKPTSKILARINRMSWETLMPWSSASSSWRTQRPACSAGLRLLWAGLAPKLHS